MGSETLPKTETVMAKTAWSKPSLWMFLVSAGVLPPRVILFTSPCLWPNPWLHNSKMQAIKCEVKVHFAGLFDTVSSHGLSFSNDTGALKLEAVPHAEDIVHLTAADEHRENFALTTIDSAGTKEREIFLPGVHSDVGGSYREGASEDQDIYWTMDSDDTEKAQAEITALTNAGWYKAHEPTLTTQPLEQYNLIQVNLHAERSYISNQYSRIPLHTMARFAQESGIVFKNKLARREKIPPELDTANQEVLAYVGQHQTKGAYSSQAAH